MRLLPLLIIGFLFNSDVTEKTLVEIVFFDSCQGKVIELPYEIHDFDINETTRVEAGEQINLKPNLYSIEVWLIHKEKSAHFYHEIIVTKEKMKDTLYLQTARFYGPTSLHPRPDEFEYLCCDKKCDGLVTDIDANGVTRFKGKYKNGSPIRKHKHYNSEGKLIKTEVYRNGQLKRIR